MVAAAALIWTWDRGLTMIDDEWGYVLRITTEPASTYLLNPPAGKHLIAVPLLFYRAVYELFGIDSDAPFQVAHIVLLLLCAGLFFVLARRRVGDWLAVLATMVLLFLGPAREVVATPLRIPALISIAAGLGMLLLLERRDLRGDVVAAFLLLVSLASLSTGYPFAAAAAVLVLARPSPARWRRAWVFLIPSALYLIWWVAEFDLGPNAQPLGSTILDLPIYLGKSLGVTILSVTGLVATGSTGELLAPLAFYVAVGAILGALLLWALVALVRRQRRVSPFLVAMAVGLLVFWAATAFAPGPERVPWASRYLYLDAVFLLLLLCEVARGLDVPRRLTTVGWAVVIVAFAISIAGNIRELRNETDLLVQDSRYIRAGLTTLEMSRGSVDPTFQLGSVLATATPERKGLLGDHLEDNGVPLGNVPAGGFFRIFDRWGSPAFTPAEIPEQSPDVRRAADIVMARAMGLRLEPTAGGASSGARPAPQPILPKGSWSAATPGCVKLSSASGTGNGMVALATQGATVHAGDGGAVTVNLGRFGDGTPVRLGTVPAGTSAEVRIPPDFATEKSPIKWRVGVADAAGASVCGLGPPVVK